MKYLVKNPLLLAYLKMFEAILPKENKPIPLQRPKKILLCNLAHRGDVVISSSVLPLLKQQYPNVEIGFLLGSWSKEVLEEHPDVSKLHTADHWKHNRSKTLLWKKMAHYLKTSAQAVQEIRQENYDWAIDLYPYFPNSIPLLWRAGVSCRIGYTSGGFGPLLTHPKHWEEKPQPMARYLADLIGSKEHTLPSLIPGSCPIQENAFVIVHIGTGNPKREWTLEKWKEVVKHFASKKCPLFFTGKGKREKEKIEALIAATSYGTSLCDKLSWQELVALVQNAQLLITVETAIMHIASAFAIPTIVIAPALTSLWTPDNPRCICLPSSSSPSALLASSDFLNPNWN